MYIYICTHTHIYGISVPSITCLLQLSLSSPTSIRRLQKNFARQPSCHFKVFKNINSDVTEYNFKCLTLYITSSSLYSLFVITVSYSSFGPDVSLSTLHLVLRQKFCTYLFLLNACHVPSPALISHLIALTIKILKPPIRSTLLTSVFYCLWLIRRGGERGGC